MKISTRGRYALLMPIDLSGEKSGGLVSLSDISTRQEISKKYLEQIALFLVKHKILETDLYPGGGYKIEEKASHYNVAEILLITEGSRASVMSGFHEKLSL